MASHVQVYTVPTIFGHYLGEGILLQPRQYTLVKHIMFDGTIYLMILVIFVMVCSSTLMACSDNIVVIVLVLCVVLIMVLLCMYVLCLCWYFST